jgi:hypothetical protein
MFPDSNDFWDDDEMSDEFEIIDSDDEITVIQEEVKDV